MKFHYGVMQGRLSTKIGKKIQAFPSKNWKEEFSKAKSLGLKSIEWTLDYRNLKKNPILSTDIFSKIGFKAHPPPFKIKYNISLI